MSISNVKKCWWCSSARGGRNAGGRWTGHDPRFSYSEVKTSVGCFKTIDLFSNSIGGIFLNKIRRFDVDIVNQHPSIPAGFALFSPSVLFFCFFCFWQPKFHVTLPETNIAHENPIFPGKYHQNSGISMAMLVYRSVPQGNPRLLWRVLYNS